MSFQVQQQIKQNASEIREYLYDLYDWEEKVEKVDKIKPKQNKEEQPIRGQVIPEKTQQLRRDGNTIKDYYEAWNKFDIDAELDETQNLKSQDSIFKQTNAKANAQILVKGGRNYQQKTQVIMQKEEANEFFKKAEYKKAVQLYQNCIEQIKEQNQLNETELEQLVVIYSNQAQCYLKLLEYNQSIFSCNEALKLNPNHIKSLLRRSTCYQQLGKWKEALRDLERTILIDPQDAEAKKGAEVLKKKLESKRQQARALLKNVKPFEDFEIIKVEDIQSQNQENILNDIDD